MADLFKRMKNAIMADLHEALDQKEQKNPIALLNQYLRECEGEAERVRKLIERQNQLKVQFLREQSEAVEMAEKRKGQAHIAEKAGEGELQAFAAAEQVQYEERAARLDEAVMSAEKQQIELERKYEDMKHKLKDMHIRRLELMGRENVNRANRKMDLVLGKELLGENGSFKLSDMEGYLDQAEKEVNSSYFRSTIDGRIAMLEKELIMKETDTI